MDSIDQISASIDKILKPLFNDKVTGAVISLIIVLYAGLAAPKLPKSISNLFKDKTFKLIVLFFIAYSASNNASIAIISAVALVVSMQTLSKHEETEKVLHKMEEVAEEKAIAEENAAIEAKHQAEAEKAAVEEAEAESKVTEEPVEVIESTEEPVEENVEEDDEIEKVVELDDYNVKPIDDSSSYGQVIEEFTEVDGTFTISNVNQGHQVDGCEGTRYGCCADDKTPASAHNDDCKGKHFVHGSPQNLEYQ